MILNSNNNHNSYVPSKRQRHLASATGAQVQLNSILDTIMVDVNRLSGNNNNNHIIRLSNTNHVTCISTTSEAESFLALVKQHEFPAYYDEIANPLCLDDIRTKTKRSEV
jgi:hypothetical protein